MTESKIYQRMRSAVAIGHFGKVENSVSTGMFDVNWAYCLVELWIELKVLKRGKIYIRGRQVAWATKRMRYGLMKNLFILGADEDRICVWNMLDILKYLDQNEPEIDSRGHIIIDSEKLQPWLSYCFKPTSFRLMINSMYKYVRSQYNDLPNTDGDIIK